MAAPLRTCSFDLCEKKHLAQGYCSTHYLRMKRNGSAGRISSVAPRQCIACQAEFTPGCRVPNAEACSVKCTNAVQYKKKKMGPPDAQCGLCGADFVRMNKPQAFCSQVCSNRVMAANRAKTKTCGDCHSVFIATSCHHKTCKACTYRRRLKKIVRRNMRRRAMRRGALGPTHSERDWDALLRKFGGRCAYCSDGVAAHRDHVIPVSRGGADSIGNILPACVACNLQKGDKTVAEWRRWRSTRIRCEAVSQAPPT